MFSMAQNACFTTKTQVLDGKSVMLQSVARVKG
jgi:hypothetical protein